MVKNSVLFLCCGGVITFVFSACSSENKNEEGLIQRALEIHDRVLTLDTHADTPIRMIEPGFDLSERHDPYETGSKVDYPRMKEGGLDAVFLPLSSLKDIRDDSGNERAKTLVREMIDAVIASTLEDNSEDVGLGLNPDDAYELEKTNKRAIYIGTRTDIPIGDDL